MVTATFLRLKMEQQLIKLRLHHCSQIKKKLILSLCTRARLWYSSHSQFWQWCIFHIAAPCSKLDITISFDTGSDNTRRLLIVIHIDNNDGSSALHFCLFVHSRVGKIKPIKLKTVRFQDVNLLDVWHISDDIVSQFTPCRKTLSQHIRRVNQTGIWKLAHIPKPNIPLAINGHV